MASRILAGRYELLEKIGEGGMAVVFKSRDRLLNRMVAIKILRPEFTRDPIFIDSFRRESQMAAGLTHPNIVNIYDVGKEGNIYYIVMELMDGRALSDIIKSQGALEPRQAANIARQIASALSAAHKNHLIHRDVKPHNIMFAPDGTAKITDFGIAKKVTGQTLVTDEHKENVMGSVHYFSPEQARAEHVDERSDIYSLGICLYEMLTGRVPFDGTTAVEVAVKHMNDKMVPPTHYKPDIPSDLEEIVLKATDKNPDNRYNNMDELITALSFVSYHRNPELEELMGATEMVDKAGDFFVPNDDLLISRESNHSVDNEPSFDNETVVAGYVHSDVVRQKKAKEKKKGKNKKKLADENAKLGLFHSKEETSSPVKEKQVHAEESSEHRGFFLKPQRYIAVLLAIVLAVFASKGIAKLMTTEKVEPITEVPVPSIVGMSETEARKLLSDKGLNLEVELELVSKDVPVGQIMSQTPTADSVMKTNQTVRVNVSKGSFDPTVPNVEGKSLSSATTVLTSYSYHVVTVYAESDKFDQGYVMSQNPKSGTELQTGGTVTLTVCSGSKQVEDLGITGLKYADAITIIQDKGYTVGVKKNEKSSDVEDGCVIKYTVNGKSVDLWVSAGAATNISQGGNEVITGSINYKIDYSGYHPETDVFTVNISIGDDNGTRTEYVQCRVDEGSHTFVVSGAGKNATVTFSTSDLYIFYTLHSVNFEDGTYSE